METNSFTGLKLRTPVINLKTKTNGALSDPFTLTVFPLISAHRHLLNFKLLCAALIKGWY